MGTDARTQPGWTLDGLAERMRDIDFSTRVEGGAIAARPMSNDREVALDGDSWFFTGEHAAMVGEIAADSPVGLGFQGKAGMLGTRPLFIAIEDEAELIRDKSLIKVHATRAHV